MMELWRRLLDFFRRGRLSAELDEELRFHRSRVAADRRADGRSAEDAEYDARRRLGNTTAIAEETRSMWSFTWFEQLMQNLRYGVRALRRRDAAGASAVGCPQTVDSTRETSSARSGTARAHD